MGQEGFPVDVPDGVDIGDVGLKPVIYNHPTPSYIELEVLKAC